MRLVVFLILLGDIRACVGLLEDYWFREERLAAAFKNLVHG